VGVVVEAEIVEDGACGCMHGRGIDEAEATECGFATEKDVLRDVQIRDQREFLEDDGDTKRAGIGGAGDGDPPALDLDIAAIGRIGAVQRLDQRRLSRAILTEDDMDLAGIDVERYVLERMHTGKGFVDADQTQQRCIGLASGRPRRRPLWGVQRAVPLLI
jgi:hypothetical protein